MLSLLIIDLLTCSQTKYQARKLIKRLRDISKRVTFTGSISKRAFPKYSTKGIEINAEMHTDDHSSRMIAIGVRYEVMGGSGHVYKLMADENGVTVWVNDEPSHSFGYGDING